jgi:hypothetical protein
VPSVVDLRNSTAGEVTIRNVMSLKSVRGAAGARSPPAGELMQNPLSLVARTNLLIKIHMYARQLLAAAADNKNAGRVSARRNYATRRNYFIL